MTRGLFFLIGLLSVTQLIYSQDFEHTIEVGPVAGTSFYLGDANQKLFACNKILIGGLIRYPLNNRIALKSALSISGINGYSDTYQVAFDHHYLFATLQGEFNFFPYERSDYNIESSIITPYILGGVGIIACGKQKKNATMVTDPISPARAVVLSCGVGGKLKINSRVDLNLEWTINKALSDRLEGVSELNNPYALNQKMTFNNDFYSTLTVAITFAIYTQRCDCRTDMKKGR